MMIALYRQDKAGQMNYYYIHDYQGNLFTPYAFTAIWGRNVSAGKEKLFSFTTRAEMDEKLQQLFKKRVKDGYKVLYSYPTENIYHNIFESTANKRVG